MIIGNNNEHKTPLNKSMTRSVSKLDFEVACFLAPREGLELQASVVPSYDWKHSVTALARITFIAQ